MAYGSQGMGAATQTASVIPHSAEKHPGSTAKGSGGGEISTLWGFLGGGVGGSECTS